MYFLFGEMSREDKSSQVECHEKLDQDHRIDRREGQRVEDTTVC